MSKVGFVILHYGNIEITKQCVGSIQQLKMQDDVCVVIVDNDCYKDDVERDRLKDEFASIDYLQILKICEDRGFSYANNCGYQYLKELLRVDYIVVTNNDIIFPQMDFIQRLEQIYEKHPFDILAPDIVGECFREHQNPLDTELRTIRQTNYTIWLNWICLKLFWVSYPFVKRIFEKKPGRVMKTIRYQENIVPCGACLIVSGRFLQQEEKMFEPETKFYYEEYILFHRCSQKNYKIIYDADVKVIHGDGVATKERSKTNRNKVKFIMKNTLDAAKIYKHLLSNISKEDKK